MHAKKSSCNQYSQEKAHVIKIKLFSLKFKSTYGPVIKPFKQNENSINITWNKLAILSVHFDFNGINNNFEMFKFI